MKGNQLINHSAFSLQPSAFTLIELLVVVSLIGVLTTLIAANLNAARERGRDAARKADLRNLQTALRLYYNDKNFFPANSEDGKIAGCGAGGITTCSWGATWSAGTNVYMSKLPADPINTQSYKYLQQDSGDSYTLSACLENRSDDKCQNPDDTAWCTSGCMYRVQP